MWLLPWRVVTVEKRILLIQGHILTRQVHDHLYLFSNLNVYQFCLEELDYDNPPNDSHLKLHMLPAVPWYASDTRFERREKVWRTKHENVYRNHDREIKHVLPTFSQTVSGCSGTWNAVCQTAIAWFIQIRNHSKATKRKSIMLKTGRCIELRSAQLHIVLNVLSVRSRQFQQLADKLRRFVCVRRDARILWTVVEWTSPTWRCFLVQNTPNDLQLLSDAPAHHIFCLLGPVDPFQTSLPLVYCVL